MGIRIAAGSGSSIATETLKAVGFEPLAESWQSCYWHEQLRLMLIVYVDDFKMAGPAENLAKGWELIRRGIVLDPPEELGLYLGCRHFIREGSLVSDRSPVRFLEYDMSDFLSGCVARYRELASDPDMKPCRTPFPSEYSLKKLKELTDGESAKRGGTGTDSVATAAGQAQQPESDADDAAEDLIRGEIYRWVPKEGSIDTPTVPGKYRIIAPRVLMKVLYAARMARFDLLRAVNHLARFTTKWEPVHDLCLHQLMCYINTTLEWRQAAWVGVNDTSDFRLHLFSDADYAGCDKTLKSTTGALLA
jgi:hypothetical protein